MTLDDLKSARKEYHTYDELSERIAKSATDPEAAQELSAVKQTAIITMLGGQRAAQRLTQPELENILNQSDEQVRDEVFQRKGQSESNYVQKVEENYDTALNSLDADRTKALISTLKPVTNTGNADHNDRAKLIGKAQNIVEGTKDEANPDYETYLKEVAEVSDYAKEVLTRKAAANPRALIGCARARAQLYEVAFQESFKNQSERKAYARTTVDNSSNEDKPKAYKQLGDLVA